MKHTFARSLLTAFAAAVLAACAGAPVVQQDRLASAGYSVVVKNVPEHRITTFEIEIRIDAPAWRVWNMAPDIQKVYQMSPSYHVLDVHVLGQGVMRKTMQLSPAWYLPSVTGVTLGKTLPDVLGWEEQCVSGWPSECYVRYSIIPLEGGKSAIKVNGYGKRPWFISFAMTAELMRSSAEAVATGIGFLIQNPKYATPDPAFPWEQFNNYSHLRSSPAAPERGAPAQPKPRMAVERLMVYGSAGTSPVMGKIAGDYLAFAVERTGAFEVTAPEDLHIMLRYLGAQWAILCDKSDECQLNLASVAKVRYLLAGDLTFEAGECYVNLVLLDQQAQKAVWRMNRPIDAGLHELKDVINESAVEIARVPKP
jgi:hypothetical protein